VLERLRNWRSIVPDMAVRSSFVVGFPGETEEDFQYLLNWLEEAQLDRVGAFKFEPVSGAAANALPDPVPEELKQERYDRVMKLSARISAERLAAKVGKTIEVLVDRVDDAFPSTEGPDRGHFDAPHAEHHHGIGATGRSRADAPEIDGEVHLRDAGHLSPGDLVRAKIEDSDEHDLFGVPLGE
jgi:ribosomal protein S12 methylthiotransferase